jgi:uncharacterized DUF497 family protein
VFEWDDGNLDHIDIHGVSAEEAEEALLDPRRLRVPSQHEADEPRWAVLGETEGGRILFVVYTTRANRIRVVTARNATRTERRRYRR